MRYFYLVFCLLYQILSATEAPSTAPSPSQTPPSSLESQPASTAPFLQPKKQPVAPADQTTPHPDQNTTPSADQTTTPSPDQNRPNSPDQNRADQEVSPHIIDYRTLVWKIFIFMGIFILLCFVTLQFFKKLSKTKLFASNNLHHIKILERRPLSSKTVLYLIDLAGKQVLVAESQLEVRSLAQIDWNVPTYEKDKSL